MLSVNYEQTFYAALTSSFLCLAAFHGDREMNGTEDSVLYTVNTKTKIMYSDNDTRLTPLPQYAEGI